MKLNKVEIINYRSCINTSLNLDNKLTVLIGPNGVGKTNILHSIMLVNKAIQKRQYSYEEADEFNSVSIIKLHFQNAGIKLQFKIEIQYEIGVNNSNMVDIYATYYKTPSSKHWTEIDASIVEHALKVRENPEASHSRLKYSRFLKSVEAPHRDGVMDIFDILTQTSYYSATQFSNPSICPISLEIEENRSHRFKRDPYETFLFDLHQSYKLGSKEFKQFLSCVNQDGIGLIDDIEFKDYPVITTSFQVKAGGIVQPVERMKFIIIPSIIIDGMTLSPNQLPDGTFKTLALIFYILTDTSKLLLIEEPEVGVHHGLLASIVELIKDKSKSKQIIVSTHSDYILDKLQPENVLLVNKDKELGTRASSLSNQLSKNDYDALKYYLENTGNLGEYWKDMGFENG